LLIIPPAVMLHTRDSISRAIVIILPSLRILKVPSIVNFSPPINLFSPNIKLCQAFTLKGMKIFTRLIF
jgi:hypothetical protein